MKTHWQKDIMKFICSSTSMQTAGLPIAIVRRGAYRFDDNGILYDASPAGDKSSWAMLIRILQLSCEALKHLEHVLFAVFYACARCAAAERC